MMKINKIFIRGIIVIILAINFNGCSSKFDSQHRVIVFSNTNHKPYYIPYYANWNWLILNLEAFKTAGIYSCKVGDTIWVEAEYYENAKNNPKSLIHKDFAKWLKPVIKKGLAGCTSPMTDQEFRYRAGQEMQNRYFQHEQNIQNQKSLNKTLDRLMPKNHNVNVHVY